MDAWSFPVGSIAYWEPDRGCVMGLLSEKGNLMWLDQPNKVWMVYSLASIRPIRARQRHHSQRRTGGAPTAEQHRAAVATEVYFCHQCGSQVADSLEVAHDGKCGKVATSVWRLWRRRRWRSWYSWAVVSSPCSYQVTELGRMRWMPLS